MDDATEDRLSVKREILTSRVPVATSATEARGPSLVAWHDGPLPGGGVVGFETFYRVATGRLWIGVAQVPSDDDVARDTLTRTLGVVRGLADSHASPAALIAAVKEDLAHDGEANSEVCLFVAALTAASGELVCASAGQRAPWITNADGAHALALTVGPPIGDPSHDYVDCAVMLAPGDRVVVAAVASAANVDSIAALVARSSEPTEAGPEPALVLHHHDLVAPTSVHTLDLRIASELDAIERVTGRFDAFAAAHHVPDAVRRTFDIAFDDLINNIVSYAYGGEVDHVIDVRIVVAPTSVEASLADDGPAFDPFAMDAPDTELDIDEREIGGLGVHLVRSMMDEARYERRDERNVIIIKKHLR